MQNKELTKELNALQEKFNKEIEDVKKKCEDKPFFKVGDYVEWMGFNSAKGRIVKQNGDCYRLSLDFSNTPSTTHDSCHYSNLRLLTPEEVEKALTKEAVKRGFKEGVKVGGFWVEITYNIKPNNCDKNYKYYLGSNNEPHFSLNGVCIFLNGTWAEIIKEKTLDEIAYEMVNYNFRDVNQSAEYIKTYLTENKEEIINALNK